MSDCDCPRRAADGKIGRVTFCTASLKVAKKTSVSAFVFSAVGVFRVNEMLDGAVVSIVTVSKPPVPVFPDASV